jgi:GNAT superfamily N-acetyltransferase
MSTERIFQRVYGDESEHPAIEEMRTLVSSFGARHRHASRLDRFDQLSIFEAFESTVKQLKLEYAAEFGPPFVLKTTPARAQTDDMLVLVLDCDTHNITDDFDPWESIDEWKGSAPAQAAYAYKHECGWVFLPDDTGIWLLAFLPFEYNGSPESGWVHGNLAGFTILYDRDEDGEIDALAHIWTAPAARRHGIAARLVQEARGRFPRLRGVESPTDMGRALFTKCWPEALAT